MEWTTRGVDVTSFPQEGHELQLVPENLLNILEILALSGVTGL